MATVNPDLNTTKAREIFEDVTQNPGETVDALQKAASDALDKARRFAEANPLATVAIGFGAGLLLAAWLKRDK